MIARTFDDGDGPRVAHAETLSNPARDEELPTRRAVADGVACEHRVVPAVLSERSDRDDSAAHAFADIVLRLSFEGQLDAGVEKRAEALARASSILAMVTRRQRGAERPSRVVDVAARRRRVRRVPVAAPEPVPGQRRVGGGEDKREVEPGARNLLEELDAPHHLLQAAGTQSGEVFADLSGDEEQVIDDVRGSAVEFAGRAGVEVALPRHVAAQRNQHAGAEPELLRSKRCGDDDVAPAADAAVRAKRDALAQPVGDEDLLGFGQTKLPRRTGIFDRRQRRRAGAAVVA